MCVPQSIKDTLQEMMDFSLLKDPRFMLICFGNILTFLGFYVPFVYAVDLAFSIGVGKSEAAILISVIGEISFHFIIRNVLE
jgi:predicted MFS family arabinose efflux permease